MEHKISSAVRKAKRPEPFHRCGNCKHYTESWFEGDLPMWDEHCYAVKTQAEMRLLDCKSWVWERA